MTRKEAIEILETMTAEPEDGQEARLSADELDAVREAIKALDQMQRLPRVFEQIEWQEQQNTRSLLRLCEQMRRPRFCDKIKAAIIERSCGRYEN